MCINLFSRTPLARRVVQCAQIALIYSVFAGCSEPDKTPVKTNPSVVDAAEDTAVDGGVDTSTDVGTKVPFDPGPQPKKRLWPVPGEITVIQVSVNSLIPKMGEAAI